MSHLTSADRLPIAQKFESLCDFSLEELLGETILVKVFSRIVKTLVRAKHDPEWYIKAAGPFFWKYRVQIEQRDINYFINHDYHEQREDWILLTNGHGVAIADAVLAAIKSNLSRFQREDPHLVVATTDCMLRLYAQYLIICRNEGHPVDEHGII